MFEEALLSIFEEIMILSWAELVVVIKLILLLLFVAFFVGSAFGISLIGTVGVKGLGKLFIFIRFSKFPEDDGGRVDKTGVLVFVLLLLFLFLLLFSFSSTL